MYLVSNVPAGLADVKERTLIAVKPDGVQRRLVGQIIRRFEQRGFKLVGLKMLQVRNPPHVLFRGVRAVDGQVRD